MTKFWEVDYYVHRLAILACAVFAWREFGFWTALGIWVGIIVVTIITNILLMQTGRLWVLTVNRWFWVVMAFALVAISR